MKRKSACFACAIVVLLGSLTCTCCKLETEVTTDPEKKGMQLPLTSFQQELTSSTASMALHSGADVKLPVLVHNPGAETWVSAGQYPVTISYKWYKDGVMLSIEGERTLLPAPVRPNQAANVTVRVLAPSEPGKYALRVTLIQEAVAWFMLKSNTFLEFLWS
jgi:hypothetical protein